MSENKNLRYCEGHLDPFYGENCPHCIAYRIQQEEMEFKVAPSQYLLDKSRKEEAEGIAKYGPIFGDKYRTTLSGKPPADDHKYLGAPQPIEPETGMHKDYWVLPEEERKKGFVRPYRDTYKHNVCGVVTKMGQALSETYATDPKYYGSTFCVGCKKHFPVSEFVWTRDGETVGS